MPTYLNCYELVEEVRYGLNDHSTNKVTGTDTSGAFQNAHIIKKINDSQRYLHGIIFTRKPELFLTSTTITMSDSTGSLPSDFFKLRRLENSDGVKIHPISLDEKHTGSYSGEEYLYYRYGNTIVCDATGFSETLTLWYFTRCRDITMGKASGGGAKSITLATTARLEADYYNGMKIENYTQGWIDTISDYSAARVATITETAAEDDYYGIISELPESFHHLIAPKAIIMMKSLPQSPVKPSPADYRDFEDMLKEAVSSYCGTSDSDVTMESIIYDFEPYM